MSRFSKVSMIGLGYIGLPTAAVLANSGPEVIGVDVNEQAVQQINSGKPHFAEADLDDLLHKVVKQGKLRAVTAPQEADAFVIAVPTPFLDDKTADLKYVESATRSLAKVLKKGDLVVLESTSPVGTTQKIRDWLAEERPDLTMPDGSETCDINIAYCPERILPGQMLRELVENDRTIGGMTPACTEAAKDLYRLFVRKQLFGTSAGVAEMVKLVENAYRDVNIAFANELGLVCDHLGLDVWETIELANKHPRVNILQPGAGVGGHCIAVDPWFLISAAPKLTPMMKTARNTNDSKPGLVASKAKALIDKTSSPVIACLGLAYKPDIDDLRESPALEIARKITETGHPTLIVEPNIDALPAEFDQHSNAKLVPLDEALKQANIVLVLVSHRPFHEVPATSVAHADIVDAVGLWRKKA